MICKKCNSNIPEDSMFCQVCGNSIEETNAESKEPHKAEDKNNQTLPVEKDKTVATAKKRNRNNAVFFAGLVCFCAGVITLLTTVMPIENTSFGGDFYTYAYQGIYAVVQLMVKLVRLLSLLLSGFGVFLIQQSKSKRID